MSITFHNDDKPPTRDGVRCQCGLVQNLSRGRKRTNAAVCPVCFSLIWWVKDVPYAKRGDQDRPVKIEPRELNV